MKKLQNTSSKFQTIRNFQIPIFKNFRLVIFVFFVCNLVSWNLIFAKDILAQTIGLSISPPIDEVMIIPGKEVDQTFTIGNNGNDGTASIYIIPFRAQGEYGNVLLDEKNSITSTSPYSSWFSIISPVTSFGEKFYLAGGQSKNVTIRISPPTSAQEKDYYFTLLYELDNDVPREFATTGPTNRARIGSNLLISVSGNGNPLKQPNITEFSAPKIIDSLQKLTFKIRVDNDGLYAFKSNGQITIKPTFGGSEILSVAPLNVISSSIRNISCINGEEMVPCQSDRKVLVGVYKSTLKITADGEGPESEKTITTIAFPFSIIFGIVFIFVTYRIIKNPKSKAKK